VEVEPRLPQHEVRRRRNDAETRSRCDAPTLPATTLLWMRVLGNSYAWPWAGTGSREFLPRQGGPEPSFASTGLCHCQISQHFIVELQSFTCYIVSPIAELTGG